MIRSAKHFASGILSKVGYEVASNPEGGYALRRINSHSPISTQTDVTTEIGPFSEIASHASPGDVIHDSLTLADLDTRFLQDCHESHSIHNSPNYAEGIQTRAYALARITNARLIGGSGIVIDQDDKIVEESVFDLSWINGKAGYQNPLRSIAVKRDDRQHVTFAFYPRARLYYHWFIDCLPRLAFLEGETWAGRPLVVVAPADLPEFALQTLVLFQNKFHNVEVEFISKGETWEIPDLLVPTCTSRHWAGCLHPQAARFVRELVLDGFGIDLDASAGRRLFVSRRQARNRRIRNEAAFELALSELGFESVVLEQYPLIDQMRLMASASIIISPHGGGLTNTLFCPPGTVVVEMFPERRKYPHYYFLCKTLGLPYAHITGSPADRALDFSVPTEQVVQMLRTLELH